MLSRLAVAELEVLLGGLPVPQHLSLDVCHDRKEIWLVLIAVVIPARSLAYTDGFARRCKSAVRMVIAVESDPARISEPYFALELCEAMIDRRAEHVLLFGSGYGLNGNCL